MSTSERLLRKWRKEALHFVDPAMYEGAKLHSIALAYAKARERILQLTQELLDQHLLKK
jgi:hypothetical protein